MVRISILDPTAPPPGVNPDAGPSLRADGLSSSNVGIRYDLTWRSFDWVRDEWTHVEHWLAGDRTADAAAETLASLNAFVGARDAVVSGLGN